MAKRGRPTNTQRILKQLSDGAVQKQTAIATDMFLPNHSGDHSAGIVNTTPTTDTDIANKKYVDDSFPVTHASTTGQTTDDHHAKSHAHDGADGSGTIAHSDTTGQGTDDHHAQSHDIASHSDTTATGTELNTLTDNSIANTLHRHSELVASDGSPDPALSVDDNGNVGIGLTNPDEKLEIDGNIKFTNVGHIIDKNANSAIAVRGSYMVLGEGLADGNVRSAAAISMEGNKIWGSLASGGDLTLESTWHATKGDVILNPTSGNVGIGVTDPHSKLEVNGAISSTTATIDASSDGFDVSGINTLFVDTGDGDVVVGGFTGGVAGQFLFVAISDTTNSVTFEDDEGTGNQDFKMHDGVDETLDNGGGWTFVCDGTYWYDVSHAKHV